MEMRIPALCQVVPIDWLAAISQIRYRRALSLVSLLLGPVGFAAGALGAWRFGTDVGWTSAFFIADGFLSHWQVWCIVAISAEVCACSLRSRAAVRMGVTV